MHQALHISTLLEKEYELPATQENLIADFIKALDDCKGGGTLRVTLEHIE